MTVPLGAPRLSLLSDVDRVSRRSRELVERSLAGHDLTGVEFAVYSLLATSGPVTVSEVARWVGSPLATISKLLARADARGHLARITNPSDGRSTLVGLSASGVAAHAAARPDVSQALRRVNEDLGGALKDVQWCLSRLDVALQRALDRNGVASLPSRSESRTLTYSGRPLTAEEEGTVREFIEWVRWRRRMR